MQINDFINENIDKALSLSLADYPAIHNTLQAQKDKLKDAELDTERNEVRVFAEKAVKELKHKLQLYLRNNHGKVNYNVLVAPYLWDIKLLLEYRELLEQTAPAENRKDEDKAWFKVGLKFAEGKIKKDKIRPSFEAIMKDAGLPLSLRPYVSDTYNENNKNGKNIFASEKKMNALYHYCKKNKIILSDWFLDKYKSFENE